MKTPNTMAVISTPNIHVTINTRGYYEQETALLYSGLYPDRFKALTKNTIGNDQHFERRHRTTWKWRTWKVPRHTKQ